MKIDIAFVGQALAFSGDRDTVAEKSFDLLGTGAGRLVPDVGDRMRLLTLDGVRTFRCVGRLFDCTEPGAPLLRVELDLDASDPARPDGARA